MSTCEYMGCSNLRVASLQWSEHAHWLCEKHFEIFNNMEFTDEDVY